MLRSNIGPSNSYFEGPTPFLCRQPGLGADDPGRPRAVRPVQFGAVLPAWHNYRLSTDLIAAPLTAFRSVHPNARIPRTHRGCLASTLQPLEYTHPWPPRSSSCVGARCASRTTASSSPTPARSVTAGPSFKGLPAPEPLRYPAAKPDKQERFNAALAEVSGEPAGEATTAPKKRPAKAAKSTAKAAEPAATAESATPAGDVAEGGAPTESPDASASTES